MRGARIAVATHAWGGEDEKHPGTTIKPSSIKNLDRISFSEARHNSDTRTQFKRPIVRGT